MFEFISKIVIFGALFAGGKTFALTCPLEGGCPSGVVRVRLFGLHEGKMCTGGLVDSKHVLTSGHCLLEEPLEYSEVDVWDGVRVQFSSVQKAYGIFEEESVHPYQAPGRADYALLVLDQPVDTVPLVSWSGEVDSKNMNLDHEWGFWGYAVNHEDEIVRLELEPALRSAPRVLSGEEEEASASFTSLYSNIEIELGMSGSLVFQSLFLSGVLSGTFEGTSPVYVPSNLYASPISIPPLQHVHNSMLDCPARLFLALTEGSSTALSAVNLSGRRCEF